MRHIDDGRRYLVVNKDEFTLTLTIWLAKLKDKAKAS